MSNVNDARRELQAFLADMTALKPFADQNSQDGQAFVAAFAAAKSKAKLAAETYVAALKA
jgi:hypothetical protein